MMKKVVSILVLMMAALVINAQTKITIPGTRTLKKGDRVALVGYIRTSGTQALKKGDRVELSMTKKELVSSIAKTRSANTDDVITETLPEPIADNIAKDFAGYTIKEATKVIVVSYEVVIAKEAATDTLVYEQVVTNPPPK